MDSSEHKENVRLKKINNLKQSKEILNEYGIDFAEFKNIF